MRLITAFSLLVLTFGTANSTEIRIVTEHYPPFQIVENNQVVGGVAVDIVRELLKQTNIEADIVAYPWARAYRLALKEKNVLIFSITRNTERDPLFKWVGSIIGSKDYLWRLKKNKKIIIHTIDEAKKYTIGVPRDDNQYNYLKKKEFSNLYITNDLDSSLKMLFAQHVDLVMGPENSILYRLQKLKLNYSEIEKAFKIGQQWGDLSIAFSIKTSDELVRQFQAALKKIKHDGTYKKMIKKWIPTDLDKN